MRKWTACLTALALAVLLAACGAGGEESEPAGEEQPPAPPPAEQGEELGRFSLEIQSAAEGNLEALQALEPLGSLLRERLAAEGYEFESVQVTMGASGRSTGEALAAGGVDAAVLQAEDYAKYAWGLPVVLSSAPEAVDLAAGEGQISVSGPAEAAPWRTGYICATGSDYGRTLAAAGGELTFDQVAGAAWAAQSGWDAQGWIQLWLEETFGGVAVADLAGLTLLEGRDELLLSAALGEADIVVLAGGEITGEGLTVLGQVGPVYEQLLALGPGQEALQDAAFQAALGRAVSGLFDGGEGQQLLRRLGVEQPLLAADEWDLEALGRMARRQEGGHP